MATWGEGAIGTVLVEHDIVIAHESPPTAFVHGDQSLALKHALDRVLALLALIVLLPVMVGTAAAVLVSLGRPVLFRQARVGRGGRPFEMLKFRTMAGDTAVEGAEEVDPLLEDRAPGGIDDGRRTRLGTFLRCMSLDELPQLINVLRGEMSLVGPRPERPVYASLFEDTVPLYRERHRVKAGITGWAQVNDLSGRTSIVQRAAYDSFYVENCSLRLDLKIALLTFGALVRKYRIGE